MRQPRKASRAAVLAIALPLFAGAAVGQQAGASFNVSFDNAAALDTGLGATLATGPIGMARDIAAPNSAQLEYRGQAASLYQPMVQAINPSALSLPNPSAIRVPTAADAAGFTWAAVSRTEPGNSKSPQTSPTYQPIGHPGGNRDAGMEDDAFASIATAAAATAGEAALPTGDASLNAAGSLSAGSCLDLPAGCEGLTIPSLSAPPGKTSRRPSPARAAARKASLGIRSGTRSGTGSGTSRPPADPASSTAKAKKTPGAPR